MEIYTTTAKNTYVTGIKAFFKMPTDSGVIPALAVTKRASVLITSGYTILIILIFMIGWNLILAIIMAFWPTRGDPNRRSVLVALWNSGESMNALTLMVSYCKRVIFYMLRPKRDEVSSDPDSNRAQSYPPVAGNGPKTDSNITGLTNEGLSVIQEKPKGTPDGNFDSTPKCGVTNLLWGILFVSIALAMSVGNVAASILVPVQLSMGNVAPAAKQAIFYPDLQHYVRNDYTGAAIAKLYAMTVPSALRALGVIEGSAAKVRKRVHLDKPTASGSALLNYDYNITGVDMGLLSDPKLKLIVKGSCRIDYTWLLNSTDEGDTYRIFGGNDTFEVTYQPKVNLPPMVNFWINPDMSETSNVSYAMIVNTAGLYSYTDSDDPWYTTDDIKDNETILYQVRRGRPVLSCWEAKRWRLNGKEVDGSKLHMLPGLKMHKFWADKVFLFEFSSPLVIRVGSAVGPSALKSSSYAPGPDFILDARASAVLDDLERLVLASWVSGRNVLRDTATYPSDAMVNWAQGPGGSEDAGPAGSSVDFVLQSGDVVTLSIRVLIAVPAILLFLFIFKKTLVCVLQDVEFGQGPILPGERDNMTALLAAQLYRGLDQRMSSRNWKHTEALVPFAYPTEIEVSYQLPRTEPDETLGGTGAPRPANAGYK